MRIARAAGASCSMADASRSVVSVPSVLLVLAPSHLCSVFWRLGKQHLLRPPLVHAQSVGKARSRTAAAAGTMGVNVRAVNRREPSQVHSIHLSPSTSNLGAN